MAPADGMRERLVSETNTRLPRQKPALVRPQRTLQRNLEEVKAQADQILTQLQGVRGGGAQVFVSEKLNALALRREELEQGLMEVEQELLQLQDHAVTAEVVRQALASVHQVYEHLKPFEQRELMRLVVHRAEIGADEIVLEVYGNLCPISEAHGTALDVSLRFGRQIWLPDEVSKKQYYTLQLTTTRKSLLISPR